MHALTIAVGPQDHAQGDESARVTLVEYGDYQCPACGAAYPVVKQLQQSLGAQLCFVFRNFPLTQVHPQALSAAMTAEFAASHDKFWSAHDALFEQQSSLGDGTYDEIAASCGLSAKELHESLKAGTFKGRISADFNGGVRSGVNGTPCFFIDGRRYDGWADVAELTRSLKTALAAPR